MHVFTLLPLMWGASDLRVDLMSIFLITGAIAGILLGLRFRSLILVPASLLATVVVIVTEGRDRLSVVVLTVIGTVASLQIGYLVSSMLRTLVGMATSASPRSRSESTHENVGYDY
jgi:hypothetical protein